MPQLKIDHALGYSEIIRYSRILEKCNPTYISFNYYDIEFLRVQIFSNQNYASPAVHHITTPIFDENFSALTLSHDYFG